MRLSYFIKLAIINTKPPIIVLFGTITGQLLDGVLEDSTIPSANN